MDRPDPPLVTTKIHTPAARQHSLERSRLLDRFESGEHAPFILVCAPAGYGKTTLLSGWAQSLQKRGTAVAWYSLDPGDDHPLAFGAYLVTAFTQAAGQAAEPRPALLQAARLLRSSPEADLQRILPVIINNVAASGQDWALILDDYHLVTSLAIHAAVAFLLDRHPPNLRIAIGSRSEPPLSLARRRARGQMLELRASDLRFTSEESSRFLNEVMRLELSEQGAAELEARTEGWAAGLQLAALSLSGREGKERIIEIFTGSHRFLADYLMEEVFRCQPEEIQSFLLATATLERMSAPLCDVILSGGSESEAILRQLEQQNLFLVPLDDQGCWFRYHHLFRDFLLARLNKTQPGRVPTLHRAACEWLASHDLLREAAAHAFQAGDWEYAATFVEMHSFTMIIYSEISTIFEWCSAFPEEVMQRHPLLALHQCWALVFSFRKQNRRRVEARLDQVIQAAAYMQDRRAAGELMDQVEVVRTFLDMAPDLSADASARLDRAQNALAAFQPSDPARFSTLLSCGYARMALRQAQAAAQDFETARSIAMSMGLYFGLVESTFHLARIAHSQGQLRRAVELCQQGQADVASLLVDPEEELPALGCLDVALGCALLEQDRLDEAERHLLHGLDLMGWGMNPYYMTVACAGLFRLFEIQGRSEEALAYLSRLETIWPDIEFCTRGLRAAHALRIHPGDARAREQVAIWSQEFTKMIGEALFAPGMGPFGAAEVFYITGLAWARVTIALGIPQEARVFLQKQIELSEASDLNTRLIELLILNALACQAEGRVEQALTQLERALRLAQNEGHIRTFDQGPALARLLVEARERGIYPEFVDQVLAATGGTAAPAPVDVFPASAVYSEALSERELEVLTLIASGASNQVIADRLYISVGTVKSHINHILGKLDAHNRTEAVARAQALHLLSQKR